MIYKRRIGDRKYYDRDGRFVVPEPPALKFKSMELWTKPRKMAVCMGCSTTRGIEEFPIIFEPDVYISDDKGRKHIPYCMHCIINMAKKFEETYESPYKAMYRLCAFSGLYYDDKLAHRVWEEGRVYTTGDEVPPEISPYELYIRSVQDDPKFSKMKFMSDGDVPWTYITHKQLNQSAVDDMTEQGKKDRNEIIEKFHYDPFDKEPAADRNQLYSSLLTLYDDSMATDLVKQKAGIEIVKAFYRIDLIGQTIQELQSTPESMVDNSKVLKQLIDQKKKETDMVTAFSKDHGFAERYQIARTKGAGTLSSVVRDGFENHFDKLAVNKFDIETGKAMQQVANISAEAMFNQIQLTGDEFRNMIEDQATEIRKLNEKVEKLKEANRLLTENVVKQELLDDYVRDLRNKGIDDEDVIALALKNASPGTYYRPLPENDENSEVSK